MNIWELDNLLLFIAFVIPGFIALKVYELLNPGSRGDSSKQVIDAIAYSCINYAILYWPILAIERSNVKDSYPNMYSIFYLFVFFIAPTIGTISWYKLRETDCMQNMIPHPIQKPWDYFFAQRGAYWMKITLKDGTQIGGKYADKSFTSSSPAKEHIYLEETWMIDKHKGILERKKKRTSGVLVISEIAFIEMMAYKEEVQNAE